MLGTDIPKEHLDRLPKEPLGLIDGLNKCRGSWLFIGSMKSNDQDPDFGASLQVEGGFKTLFEEVGRPGPGWLASKHTVATGKTRAHLEDQSLANDGKVRPPVAGLFYLLPRRYRNGCHRRALIRRTLGLAKSNANADTHSRSTP